MWSGYELVLKKSPCLLCVSLHVFGVEAFSLKTTKQKGAWQRTSFKGWSTHILWRHSLLFLYFNPRDNERNDSNPLSSKEGQSKDQVMSWFLKESMFTLCILLHVFGVEALSLKTTKQKGAWQGLPLKVGQHIYCDSILYYTYILTPGDNERNDSTTQSKEGPRDDQVMSFSLK